MAGECVLDLAHDNRVADFVNTVINIGKEVNHQLQLLCVCALLLHLNHYNVFRPIWAIFR
jgi:hypothetical protein